MGLFWCSNIVHSFKLESMVMASVLSLSCCFHVCFLSGYLLKSALWSLLCLSIIKWSEILYGVFFFLPPSPSLSFPFTSPIIFSLLPFLAHLTSPLQIKLNFGCLCHGKCRERGDLMPEKSIVMINLFNSIHVQMCPVSTWGEYLSCCLIWTSYLLL